MQYARAKKTMPLFKKIKFFIILVFIIFLLSKAYLLVNSIKNKEIVSSSVITERLSKISELSTMKYSYSNVLALKNQKKISDFAIPFTEKSFLIKYNGYIKAGIDLKKDVKVDVNGKEVIINLKKAKILDHVVDEKDLYVYDEKSSIFNKLTMNDMISEIVKEKSKVETNLINSGFLNDTTNNTKALIEGMMHDMGFQKVDIVVN